MDTITNENDELCAIASFLLHKTAQDTSYKPFDSKIFVLETAANQSNILEYTFLFNEEDIIFCKNKRMIRSSFGKYWREYRDDGIQIIAKDLRLAGKLVFRPWIRENNFKGERKITESPKPLLDFLTITSFKPNYIHDCDDIPASWKQKEIEFEHNIEHIQKKYNQSRYNYHMIIDAKSDEIYGNLLSIAAVLYDKNGNIIKSFYSILDNIAIEEIQYKSTLTNIIPNINNIKKVINSTERDTVSYPQYLDIIGLNNIILCEDSETLISNFDNFWSQCALFINDRDIMFLSDMPYPIEYFICENSNIEEIRNSHIYDIRTILYTIGENPSIAYDKILNRNTDKENFDAFATCLNIEYIFQWSKHVPYSYHNFLFPFYFRSHKNSINEQMESALEKTVLNSQFWLPTNKNIARQTYINFHYFNDNAREAIYGLTDTVVKTYTFWPQQIYNNAIYTIQKGNNTYHLNINAINLKVYNNGAAVLSIETENREYSSLNVINKINDLGRRINSPIIPPDNVNLENDILCADKIIIDFNHQDVKPIETDFLDYYRKNSNSDLTFIAPFIQQLLSFRSTKWAITPNITFYRNNKNKKVLLMVPCVNSYMFVVSLIHSRELIKSCKEIYGHTIPHMKYGYELHKDIADLLYDTVFIEQTDDSCKNRTINKNLLEQHLYANHIESGTIHAITSNSLICIVEEMAATKNSIVMSFLTQYMEMAKLAIIQKASLKVFKNETKFITYGMERPNARIDRNKIDDLIDFQEYYIAFKDQILLSEVTPNRQGEVIYKKLIESLHIQEEQDKLENQINSIYEMTNISQRFKFNIWSSLFATLSVLFAIDLIAYDIIDRTGWLQNSIIWSYVPQYSIHVICFITSVLLFLITKLRLKK